LHEIYAEQFYSCYMLSCYAYMLGFALKADHVKLWIYAGGNGSAESEVIAKYEIMDGLPVRGRNLVVF